MNVVMTGGTSGLGLAAAQRLEHTLGVDLIVGSRIIRDPNHQLKLNLADLCSVDSFVDAVIERLNGTLIDALILNAGLVYPPEPATVDGFETTFAVNHLAHYRILRCLDAHLAVGAKVIVTSSAGHDPGKNKVTPPVHANAIWLAYPENDRDRPSTAFKRAGYAYSVSKLCNVLMARTFSQMPSSRARQLTILAYNPGGVPGTGLGRTSPGWVRLLTNGLLPILRPLLKWNSPQSAGNALVDLALGHAKPPIGRLYASLVQGTITWPDPSELARRDDLGQALWADSAKLLKMGP